VLAASATKAGTITGGGGVDTVDFSNVTAASVIVNLDSVAHDGVSANTASIQYGTPLADSLSGISNAIGSSFGGDQLFAASTGSTLVGSTTNADTLNGGAGNDTLIDLGAADIMTGGAGNNLFVFENPLSGHTATITDFNASSGNEIVVNVADQAYTPQTGGSISASQLFDGAPSNTGVNNSFFIQTIDASHHDLWYSPDGTAAHAVDLAHLGTGVPTAAQIHTH
jgi:Ca2+-binding RTX toxin-like protein